MGPLPYGGGLFVARELALVAKSCAKVFCRFVLHCDFSMICSISAFKLKESLKIQYFFQYLGQKLKRNGNTQKFFDICKKIERFIENSINFSIFLSKIEQKWKYAVFFQYLENY